MKIEKIWAVFFSPAKSTEKIVIATASAAAGTLGLETVHFLDLTRPENRKEEVSFGDGDFVVIGTPTYAGRVPNKIMPYIREKIKGEGAVCTVLTTYGNRRRTASRYWAEALLSVVMPSHRHWRRIGRDRRILRWQKCWEEKLQKKLRQIN